MPRLYTYFRSSAAYRVRIALQLKGLAHEAVPVHLLRHGGEQLQADYAALNPARLVPLWQEGTLSLRQSLAIIEYLEETYPQPPLLPLDAAERARVRALALDIACDIHPLNNLRVMRYLDSQLRLSEAQRNQWSLHWLRQGLGAFEQALRGGTAGRCCDGDVPGMADCCLIPQVYNARRLGLALEPYPIIRRIDDYCRSLLPFQRAHPSAQADAD